MALARTVYYSSELVSVRFVRCRSASPEAGDVELAHADMLVLPLRGAFVEHYSRRMQVLADPATALVFPAGRESRISHPAGGEDDSLVLEFAPSCFQEVLESAGVRDVGTHCVLPPQLMAARNLLWRRLEHGHATGLEVEETAARLLSQSLKTSAEPPFRASERSRFAGRIEAVQVELMQRPEEEWSLSALARKVDCSPFYLTRMFRAQLGMPLHQYHLHARLSRSMDLLLNTDREVTDIAFELGFSSHSHFTSVFRRQVGMTPRAFRKAADSRGLSGVRSVNP